MPPLGPRVLVSTLALGLSATLLAGCSPFGSAVDEPWHTPAATGAPAADDGPALDADGRPLGLPGRPRYAAGDGIDLGVVPGSRAEANRALATVAATFRRENTGFFRLSEPGVPDSELGSGIWEMRGRRAETTYLLGDTELTLRSSPRDFWVSTRSEGQAVWSEKCWLHLALESVEQAPAVRLALRARALGTSRVSDGDVVADVRLVDVVDLIFPAVSQELGPKFRTSRREVPAILSLDADGVLSEILVPMREVVDAAGSPRLSRVFDDELYLGELEVYYSDFGTSLVAEPPPGEAIVEASPAEARNPEAACIAAGKEPTPRVAS